MTNTMDKDRALFKLAMLIETRKNQMKTIMRKKSWKESEKVIALADCREQIQAIDYAISIIKQVS